VVGTAGERWKKMPCDDHQQACVMVLGSWKGTGLPGCEQSQSWLVCAGEWCPCTHLVWMSAFWERHQWEAHSGRAAPPGRLGSIGSCLRS